MSSPLMISVAGARGIVGESLTPDVLARFAGAFARELPEGAVVVGRDARLSGAMAYRAVAAGLMAAGRDVIDLGLASTPATEIAVEVLGGAGGIILTASHNPAQWNALKFLTARGEFFDPALGARVKARFQKGERLWVEFDRLGSERKEGKADDWHLERVLGLDVIERSAIRARRLTAVVDGCSSTGGVTAPRLLRELGATVVELDCEPSGRFTRGLEPLPENLSALSRRVVDAGADFGVALDPDADRAALVDASGVPLGEEYTLALAAEVVLARKPGPVVTNLSTSRMIEAVCAHYGVPLSRTPVGEAHVVAEMRARQAVVGGEGNGGVILPAAHHGRDGLVAIALVAQALSGGDTLRGLADRLPRLAMLKDKTQPVDLPWQVAADRLRAGFPGYVADTADGLRLSGDQEWIHVRPSGTEPIVRVIAESPREDRTRELIDRAMRVLGSQ